jgi:DNA-binding PadR family transcriptional regulator
MDFNGLDTVVHGPLRLGVLTHLQVEGPLDFSALKQRLEATDGLIGSHLLKLEEAGYITSAKKFVHRRPKTIYRLTAAGRGALTAYLDAMRGLIDRVAAANMRR